MRYWSGLAFIGIALVFGTWLKWLPSFLTFGAYAWGMVLLLVSEMKDAIKEAILEAHGIREVYKAPNEDD